MHRSAPRRAIAAVAAASLLASLLIALVPALPAAGRSPVGITAREVATTVARQRILQLPIVATHVALHWHGVPDARVTVAFASTAGAFGEALEVGLDDGGEARDDGETYGAVLWAGGARFVRVTSDRPIGHVSVLAIDADGPSLGPAVPIAAAGAVAEAAVAAPTIISRAAWGANEALRFDGGGHEQWPPSYAPLQKLVVHHTAGRNNDPDPEATIRSIYYYHTVTQDWGDIGYNFLIDAQGRIYQGRHSHAYPAGASPTGEDASGNPVRGGHAKGFNDGTIGIALLGTFDTIQPPTAQRAALERLLAWEAERHGIDPTVTSMYTNTVTGTKKVLPNILGHRDVNATDCPGDAFYAALASVRTAVAARIAASTGAPGDTTPPTAVLSPMTATTGGQSMAFGLVFNEPVTGLVPEAFTVGGTSSGWAVIGISGVASTYTVSLHSDAPTDGTVELSLAAGSVTDGAALTGPAAPLQASAAYALDEGAPTAVLYATPHQNPTTATSFDVTLTFSEPVVGLLPQDLSIGGTSNAVTPWTVEQVVGSGANYGFTIKSPNPANGTVIVGVPDGATSDPAGNSNVGVSLTIKVDRTAPATAAPRIAWRAGVTMSSAAPPARLTWTAADIGGAGLASYDVARSLDGGTFYLIASGLTSPALNVNLAVGHAYRYEVRARDRAGNIGAWVAGPTIKPSLVQQSSTAIAYHGVWTVVSSSVYSGNSARYATAAGASASLTTSARSLAFVTSRGPTRGLVRIYVDGSYVTTIDLYAPTASYRFVAYSRMWTYLGTHTLKVIVVGTPGRPRVDFDAIEVAR